MKRRLSILFVLFIVGVFTGFAETQPGGGMKVGVDVDLSCAAKVYISENLSYMYRFSNGLAVNAGFRVSENVLHNETENYVYYIPYFRGYYKAYYLGAGLLINSEIAGPTLFLDTGFEFGNWDTGNGISCALIGFEYSPTLCYVNAVNDTTEAKLGSGISTAILSILNFVKINIGYTWYLQF